jgi:threonine synthase
MQSALSHLECPECGRQYDCRRPQTICKNCGSPLIARYDLAQAGKTLNATAVASRPRGIWRWAELLPVREEKDRIALGEGDTPLVASHRLAGSLGLSDVRIKDESGNPTGSFKARGLAAAVSKALELGMKELVIPTAGNAGGALAAYAARASMKAHVFMPRDAPAANQHEVISFGAELILVDGLISDAGKRAAEAAAKNGWFDVSTFKEPYRVEGKKTMGFELFEHYGGHLPDVVLYPTGGGTGLVGMWKAFDELEALGWIDAARPRMISVQAAGCAPVVRAFASGMDRIEAWVGAETLAAGLRVPAPFADRLILRALRASKGTAIDVTDHEIQAAQRDLASQEGLLCAPEGAATWAALKKLTDQGWIKREERVVLFNTGSGLKYL